MGKIKIVVVDDHQMFLDGIVSVLSNDNSFEILFVDNNAKAVLDKINYNIPDIVLTDISMPEMNGLEFIKLLKIKLPQIKILVISMFQDLKSFEDIDGYLSKDTDSTELIKAIKKIVIENEKYFVKDFQNSEDLIFKKTILSSREKEIVRLIANELTSDEIAEKLFVSKGTIETHRKNIFYKLQVKNIAGLIKKAMHLGVIK